MNIQYTTLKPGCVLLYKEYNWLRKLWAKMGKKILPYNRFRLFCDSCDLVNTFSKSTDTVIAEPKRNYSKREIKILDSLVACGSDNLSIGLEDASIKDLFTAINIIRTDTFPENTNNLQAFLDSKYYNIKALSDEKNWNEYIF